jgi:hypothetical protein
VYVAVTPFPSLNIHAQLTAASTPVFCFDGVFHLCTFRLSYIAAGIIKKKFHLVHDVMDFGRQYHVVYAFPSSFSFVSCLFSPSHAVSHIFSMCLVVPLSHELKFNS